MMGMTIKMSINLNQELGQISLPQIMVDDLGWDHITKDVMSSYSLMLRIQPNMKIAWNLAINNVYSAWNGMRSLI